MPAHATVAEQALYQEVGQLIPRVRRLIWATAARRLEERGETMLAWHVIGRVLKSGPITQRELSDAIAQHPTGVCRILDDLEARRLVKRTRDTGDRRRMNVEVTAAGRRFWQTLLPDVLGSVELALRPLSDGERRALRDLMRKLVAAVPEPKKDPRRR